MARVFTPIQARADPGDIPPERHNRTPDPGAGQPSSCATRSGFFAAAVLTGQVLAANEVAGVVKVTPLGSHDGEFCRFDRALLFEDPDGTRVLYDAGRTVAGADDPRLGRLDVVLVSHLHGDHVGDRHIAHVNTGECANPETPVVATPAKSTVAIALAKKASILTGSEMPKFFAKRLRQPGAVIRRTRCWCDSAARRRIGGVTFTTVPAVHSNGSRRNSSVAHWAR